MLSAFRNLCLHTFSKLFYPETTGATGTIPCSFKRPQHRESSINLRSEMCYFLLPMRNFMTFTWSSGMSRTFEKFYLTKFLVLLSVCFLTLFRTLFCALVQNKVFLATFEEYD